MGRALVMLGRLLSWCERSFERAAGQAAGTGTARGEFISTLIIDQGGTPRPGHERSIRPTRGD